MVEADPKVRRRAIIASTVGLAMEWYDFTLYGVASALVFGTVFFPSNSPTLSLLASFATFGVGFAARPIGGFLFGSLGDRLGRRTILLATLTLMGISTFLMGLLPSHATVGVLAPVLLVVLRIAQGLGSGAEYAGSTLLGAEYAPDRRRGLMAAIPSTGSPLGVILASAVITPFAALPHAQFLAWGWRVPFLFSVLLFGVGIYIRLHVMETPVFQQQAMATQARPRVPAFTVVHRRPKQFGTAFLLNIGPNVTSYLPAVYALSFLTDNVGMPPTVGTTALLVANIGALIMLPFSGYLSDRLGRRAVFIGGALLCAVMAFPFFVMLETGSIPLIWIAFLLVFTVSGDALLGSQASMLPELFPTAMRYSGVAFSRELASAAVGGTIPFIATAIVAFGGGTTGVSILVIVLALVAGLGAYLARETRGTSLLDVPGRSMAASSDE